MSPDSYHSPLRAQPDQGFTNLCNSICIITLVRIKVTSEINATNSAHQSALISLLTCLESSLGVVNACLPVSKPALDKLKPDSLINAVWSWTSSKRSATSRNYEMHAKPKLVASPMGQESKRKEWKPSLESVTNVPNAVWSPLSSPRQGLE